jgi:hypothetical protein
MGWWARQSRRSFDLRHGVDADLVAENRRRRRLAWALLGSGFLMAVLLDRIRPTGWLRTVSSVVLGILFIAGFVLLRWAGAESSFLNKPDPEKPPSLFGNE